MMPKFKHCESCGMPLMKAQDFGGLDENNTWCCYCSNEDGSHKSYEEVLNGMANFMMSEEAQKMSGEVYDSLEDAKIAAKEYLSKMPAWKKE